MMTDASYSAFRSGRIVALRRMVFVKALRFRGWFRGAVLSPLAWRLVAINLAVSAALMCGFWGFAALGIARPGTPVADAVDLAVFALLVSVIAGFFAANQILRPVVHLTHAMGGAKGQRAPSSTVAGPTLTALTNRGDEIGKLAQATKTTLEALAYGIEANEQLAAEIAHEVKNPLASLASAAASLDRDITQDQKTVLLGIVKDDVHRLTRLVSEISEASRLDSELVKEKVAPFDVLSLLRTLTTSLALDAESKGIDFILDLPDQAIEIAGLESRLAQVFVNLIANAMSFCGQGDAIRVWARLRENRVLIVTEDTGPGLPEGAQDRIFNRFYSERPMDEFGAHSGLGLAISKQIVEAHGGVIWAENIRPTSTDITSEPLGARFVVGLTV